MTARHSLGRLVIGHLAREAAGVAFGVSAVDGRAEGRGTWGCRVDPGRICRQPSPDAPASGPRPFPPVPGARESTSTEVGHRRHRRQMAGRITNTNLIVSAGPSAAPGPSTDRRESHQCRRCVCFCGRGTGVDGRWFRRADYTAGARCPPAAARPVTAPSSVTA